jgi:Protein of unknown function (DUF2510)
MEINAGQQYVQQANVPGQPEAAIQQLTNGLTGVPGYTITPTSPTSLTLTRKFLPQWALITAIIGAVLVCGLGLLLLLVKEEEALSITATSTGGGTRLDVSGAASAAMINRLTGVINNLGGQVAATPGVPTGFAPAATAPAPAAAPAAPTPPAPAAPQGGAPAASTEAAWHPDPSGRHEQRYWDGANWTDHVMDGGQPGSDPPPTA